MASAAAIYVEHHVRKMADLCYYVKLIFIFISKMKKLFILNPSPLNKKQHANSANHDGDVSNIENTRPKRADTYINKICDVAAQKYTVN